MPNLNEDVVVLEIEVTKQTVQDLKNMISEHLWDFNAGLRLILGAGLGALMAQRVKDAQTDQEKTLKLTRLLTESEGRLVGSRYELSEIKNILKRWELSDGGTRELVVSAQQVIQRQHQELDELKSRLKEKEIELEHLRAQLEKEGRLPLDGLASGGRDHDSKWHLWQRGK
jgi:hypothetical protein